MKFRPLDIHYKSTNSTPEVFHIFVMNFAVTKIRTYLPSPNIL